MSSGIDEPEPLNISRKEVAGRIANAVGIYGGYAENLTTDLEKMLDAVLDQRRKILEIGRIIQCPTHNIADIMDGVTRLKEEHRRVTSEHASALATERAAHEAEKRRTHALEADLSVLRAELASVRKANSDMFNERTAMEAGIRDAVSVITDGSGRGVVGTIASVKALVQELLETRRKLCPAPQPARPAGSADRLDEVLSARLIARAQLPAGVLGSAGAAALATMLAEQLGAALDALDEARDEDQ